MSRTERRRIEFPSYGESARVIDSARDSGCDHWGCHGWKRPSRRHLRHSASAMLRTDPEQIPSRQGKNFY